MKDPKNNKFRRINLENNAFKKRVGKVVGGKQMLIAAGFVEENEFLVMNRPDL